MKEEETNFQLSEMWSEGEFLYMVMRGKVHRSSDGANWVEFENGDLNKKEYTNEIRDEG